MYAPPSASTALPTQQHSPFMSMCMHGAVRARGPCVPVVFWGQGRACAKGGGRVSLIWVVYVLLYAKLPPPPPGPGAGSRDTALTPVIDLSDSKLRELVLLH